LESVANAERKGFKVKRVIEAMLARLVLKALSDQRVRREIQEILAPEAKRANAEMPARLVNVAMSDLLAQVARREIVASVVRSGLRA